MVTTARLTPRRRRAGRPTISPSGTAASEARIIENGKPIPSWSAMWVRAKALTPAMARLEVAIGVPEAGLETLASTTFTQLRSLSIKPNPSGSYDDGLAQGRAVSKGMKALTTTNGLPALSELALLLLAREYTGSFVDRTAEHYMCVLRAPFAPQLETLKVRCAWTSSRVSPDVLTGWVDAARMHLPKLRTLELVAEARLVADLVARTARVELDMNRHNQGPELPPYALRHIEVGRSIVEQSELSWGGP